MTRGDMRVLLQDRLQDRTEETWTIAKLNARLNDGLRKIQERICFIDPYFLIYRDFADIVINEPRIKKPVNLLYEFRLDRLSETGNTYSRMTRDDDQNVDDTPRAMVYSLDGQYFRLSEVPSKSVSSGLLVKYMPILTMADDSDVPDITIMLHPAVVVAAQIEALASTGVSREALMSELESKANPTILGLYYQRTAADLDQLKAEYGKVRY